MQKSQPSKETKSNNQGKYRVWKKDHFLAYYAVCQVSWSWPEPESYARRLIHLAAADSC